MYQAKQKNMKKIPVAGRLQNVSGKTFTAVVLVSVMVLLWGRVLLKGKGGPQTAAAQGQQQIEELALQSAKPLVLVPKTLDVLPGRHDGLKKDMFSTDGWDVFGSKNDNAKETISESDENALEQRHQADLKKIAARLKIEAVIRDADGNPYQIFVNDEILTVGSVLTVKEGPEQYELVLKEISENEAMFAWNKISITLKMAETVE